MSQQCEAAKDASIISCSSLRGIGARTIEGMSFFGELPPLGSVEKLELVHLETKLNRSLSACCEERLHGRGACLEKGRL